MFHNAFLLVFSSKFFGGVGQGFLSGSPFSQQKIEVWTCTLLSSPISGIYNQKNNNVAAMLVV